MGMPAEIVHHGPVDRSCHTKIGIRGEPVSKFLRFVEEIDNLSGSMHKVKFAVFLVLLLVLFSSAIQFRFSIFRELPLKGFFSQEAEPSLKYFTWRRWFSHDFQQVFSDRLNEHTGFRNSLIRINNQFDYTFFGIAHAKGFLKGKDRYLYEEDYIHEYTGRYFIGNKAIDKKMSRLKNVMDSLASYNIPLVLVFESGKASIYPEYIPSRFHPGGKTVSNYDYFLSRSSEIGMPFLDINQFLLDRKDTSRYPLFPRYGMHWSLYGVHLVADTLSRYLAGVSGKPMPAFKIRQLHHSGQSLGSDYDIGELLNLVCPLEATPGVMPLVSFSAIPDGTMSALVVADSYYIMLAETYGKKMFGRQEYWYYNSSLYPHQNEVPPVKADKTNLREKLKSYDLVMLMVSEINLHCGFWNFADEAFRAFHPEIQDSHLDDIENNIRIDREWFRFMVKKSMEQQRPLEEVIRTDAEYTFLTNYENLPGKGYMDSIQFLRLAIRNDPEWLANVTRKAETLDITVDSAIWMDAIYSYDQSKKNH